MGASFCVIFESDVPPLGTLGGDNLAVLKSQRKLDRVARDAGLRSLDEFESDDPQYAVADLDLDPDELGLPPVEWFAAADGLTAVGRLIAHLNARPAAVPRQQDVLADLAAVEAELAQADRAGVRFRFAVVP